MANGRDDARVRVSLEFDLFVPEAKTLQPVIDEIATGFAKMVDHGIVSRFAVAGNTKTRVIESLNETASREALPQEPKHPPAALIGGSRVTNKTHPETRNTFLS